MLIEQTWKHREDSEEGAKAIVKDYENRSLEEGYIVKKRDISYKAKKDRKTGEITEETWTVTVTVSYE